MSATGTATSKQQLAGATNEINLTGTTDANADGSRQQVVTPALALVFIASFGALSSFYLLLSVVPLYATSSGGGASAGWATGALMLATVAAELVTPRLMAAYGYRLTFAAGLVLLGAPALVLTVSDSMVTILLVCAVRGVGFALTVVVGGALVALMVHPDRRGEGLGLYGIVCGVPSVVALPVGMWLADGVGYTAAFVAGTVVALAGLAAVPGLPRHEPASDDQPVGLVEGLRSPQLLRPSLVFAATATAGGIVVTFLPLAVGHGSGQLVTVALLAQAVATTVARWWAGRHGDHHGQASLLLPGLLLATSGTSLLTLTSSDMAVVAGMVIFGLGFGVVQTASLTLMLDRVEAPSFGMVSALWSLAYDAAFGLGAAGFGLVAGQTGYAAAFAMVAAVMLTAIAPARRHHRLTAPHSASLTLPPRFALEPVG